MENPSFIHIFLGTFMIVFFKSLCKLNSGHLSWRRFQLRGSGWGNFNRDFHDFEILPLPMGMYRRYTSKVGPNPAFVEPHPTCLPPFQEPWDMSCDTWSSSCHQLMISEWIIYQLLEFFSQIWSQSNLDPKPTKQEMRIIINKTHIGRVKHTAC